MASYQVKQGQSLWTIAKANPLPGVSVTERIRQIAAASGIKNANKIKAGQVITIPGGKETTVDIPNPRMRPEPKPPAPRQGVPPGVGANRAAMEASRQDGSMASAFTSAAPGVMADSYPAGAGGARPDPTRRPWPAPSPPPFTSPVMGRPETPAPTGLPAAPLETEVMSRPETPAPTGLPMSEILMQEGPGMNADGLIRDVSPEERGLQGQPMPLPMSPEAMDPMIAQQLQAIPQEPAIIGPQFTDETFSPTPGGNLDPMQRRALIEALMRGQM